MSTVKTNNVQVGQSGTATNNFTLYQPTSPDGTVRLGVGNSGATTADAFVVNSSSRAGLGTTTLTSISGTVSTLSIGGTNATTSGGIAYQTNGTVKGYHYIDSDVMTHQSVSAGHKFLANNVTSVLAVGAGTTVVLQGGSSSSGTGIAFPATQSASTDANTLDDYEEGSWTPTYTSTGATFTYTGQNGRYIKVGNLVWVSFALQTTNVSGTTTNALYVSGLPSTPLNSPGNYSAIGGPTSNFNAVPTGITESPTGIALYQSGTVSVQTPTTAGLASTTKYLWGSMVYTV